ncbi:hypothetical protein [Mannheimia indoligenes]|uniref:hypothetical protein n=1 Tax=Mannheimia indoligenes TaxID=3103145 RepID=UPI002FE59061
MWLGYGNGTKTLISSFLLFSGIVWANPLVLGYQATIESYLINSGVAPSIASEDASKMTSSIFGSSRYGPHFEQYKNSVKNTTSSTSPPPVDNTLFKDVDDDLSIANAIFDREVISSMKVKYKKGYEGLIFHVMDKGNYLDRENLRKMFKGDTGFDIVFRSTMPYGDLLQYGQDEFAKDSNMILDPSSLFAVAPEWYGTTGMYLYRTEIPVRTRKGEKLYFYSNDLFNIYTYGLGQGRIPFAKDNEYVTVKLGTDEQGKEINFDIYRDEADIYSNEQDAGLELIHSYDNRYTLNYLYERHIRDYTDFEDDKLHFSVDGGCNSDANCIYQGLLGNSGSYEFIEEGKGSLLLVKDRHDLETVEETEAGKDEPEEDVMIYENMDKIFGTSSELRAENYKLTDDTLSELYESITRMWLLRGGIHKYGLGADYSESITSSLGLDPVEFDLSPKAKNALGSNFSLSHRDIPKSVSGSVSTSSVSEPKVALRDSFWASGSSSKRSYRLIGKDNNIGDGTSTNTGSDTNAGGGSTTVDTPTKNDDRLPLPGNGSSVDTNSGASGNSGTGSSTGTGSDTNAGAGSATNAGSTTGSTAGSKSTTQTGSTTTGTTGEKAEDEELDKPDLPTIPEASDILKPLLDWRNELLSSFVSPSIGGSCPTYTISIFDTNIEMESHCTVFEKISGALSAISMLFWYFLAFRIVMSA